MKLREIKLSELESLISSPEYAFWKYVPISPARAYSQSRNPYVRPDDIVLVIAIDDSGELIAYAGALPSGIQAKENQRFAWNSCWWASENAGAEVSMQVFIRFLQVWEKKVAFSDLTEKTSRIIRNLGFCQVFEREGMVVKIRSGISQKLKSRSLSGKPYGVIARLAGSSGITGLVDKCINFLNSISGRMRIKTDYDVITPRIIAFPSETDMEFIRLKGGNNFYNPGMEELKMPAWLTSKTTSNAWLSKKYYFSSFASDFKSYWLRWEIEGSLVALMMVSKRDGLIKTLYSYSSPEFRDKMAEMFITFCYSDKSIHTLITTQPEIIKLISGEKIKYLSSKSFTRYSAISKELLKYFNEIPAMNDGDGDYRFT
ncbi:MAG: hypothetical protein H6540_02680 [Bacteroidales bacterium]|nr:hypothetical protein [Bacteroidales bacterium]